MKSGVVQLLLYGVMVNSQKTMTEKFLTTRGQKKIRLPIYVAQIKPLVRFVGENDPFIKPW